MTQVNCTKVLFILFVTGLGCSASRTQSEPQVIAPREIPKLIRSLPDYARFSVSGMSFFRDRLYVTTNLGLMVVAAGKIEALYQWHSGDSVVEGPWNDVAHDALWIQHAADGSLARYDGTRWSRVQLPQSPKGYYSRGDMLNGFLGISGGQEFRIVGGGNAWRWTASGEWLLEPPPPAPQWSATRAVAPIGSSLLFVVREGTEVLPPSPYAVYDRQRNWQRSSLATMDFKQIVVTSTAAYVRADDGSLFSVTAESIRPVETPSRCETIARTSAGDLLASFRNKGIYDLVAGQWRLRAPYPGDPEGEHWAYLAENGGSQIAYATSSVPHLTGADGNSAYSGTVALWVLRDGKFARVAFE